MDRKNIHGIVVRAEKENSDHYVIINREEGNGKPPQLYFPRQDISAVGPSLAAARRDVQNLLIRAGHQRREKSRQGFSPWPSWPLC